MAHKNALAGVDCLDAWQKRGAITRKGLVVIDSNEVHGVLANEFQLLRCIIWQQIMLRQNLH